MQTTLNAINETVIDHWKSHYIVSYLENDALGMGISFTKLTQLFESRQINAEELIEIFKLLGVK